MIRIRGILCLTDQYNEWQRDFEHFWTMLMWCNAVHSKGPKKVEGGFKEGQQRCKNWSTHGSTWFKEGPHMSANARSLAAESLTYHSAACCSSLAWTRKSELQTITYVLWACSNHIEVTYVVLFQFKEVSSKRGCEETRLRMCSQFHRKGKAMPKWSREAAVPCQRSMSFHVINHDITHSITNPYYCNPY